MISIDTNVLLRYLTNDDEEQAARALRLICGSQKVLVTNMVLVELAWTLRGKRYKLNRKQIAKVINSLFEEPNIEFENGQVVWRALSVYVQAPIIKVGKKNKTADFADVLILFCSLHTVENKGYDWNGFFSFDQAAQCLEGVEEP